MGRPRRTLVCSWRRRSTSTARTRASCTSSVVRSLFFCSFRSQRVDIAHLLHVPPVMVASFLDSLSPDDLPTIFRFFSTRPNASNWSSFVVMEDIYGLYFRKRAACISMMSASMDETGIVESLLFFFRAMYLLLLGWKTRRRKWCKSVGDA